MKIIPYIAVITLGLSSLSGTLAAGPGSDHGHEHTKKHAGPNGGRLITGVSPHAEFFVDAERFAQITFVNAESEVTAPTGQVVSLTGGDRSNPIKLSFTSVDGVLRSTEALPEQPNMPIILSIKPTTDTKAVREKFYLNQSMCGSCDYQEYACICGH